MSFSSGFAYANKVADLHCIYLLLVLVTSFTLWFYTAFMIPYRKHTVHDLSVFGRS